MKNVIFVLVLLNLSLSVTAQSVLNEGSIQYELVDVISSEPEAQQIIEMMKGASLEVFFNREWQRMDVNMMGGMMNFKIYNNPKEKKSVMLQELIGQKFKINMSESDQHKKAGSNPKLEDFKITDNKKDKKKILNYECHNVVIANKKNPKDFSINCYITDKIKTPVSIIKEAQFLELSGVPLEYHIKMSQMELVYVAKGIENSLPKDAFVIPTKGYKEMTMEDYLKKMGGMAGSGGFGF